MEEQFIPYDQALALKELGFDEPCFGEYRQWDGGEPYLKLFQDIDECSTDPADFEYTVECSAPLWQQAFDWFRDEKSLISNLAYSYGNNFSYEIYHKYSFENKGGVGNNDDHQWYKSQQEARQACLEKLIEIVKK